MFSASNTKHDYFSVLALYDASVDITLASYKYILLLHFHMQKKTTTKNFQRVFLQSGGFYSIVFYSTLILMYLFKVSAQLC